MMNGNILIIDDTPEQIHTIANILKEQGYRLRVCVDAHQAIHYIEAHKPDLILLDIVMPGRSGIELCEIIKAQPIYEEIPIIFLTVLTDMETIINAFNAGAQDYVSKPVNPKELLARVDVQLQLKTKTDKLREAYTEIENFNHIICHDLKSPLWTIKNLVGFCNEEMTHLNNEKVDKYLECLDHKVTDTIHLLDKLSDLSKATSKAMTYEKWHMGNMVAEVIETLKRENPERLVNLIIGELPEVYVDQLLYKQVLYNILSNSYKYTRYVTLAKIEITCICQEEYFLFCISDNGAGFDHTESDGIFTMFQRFHAPSQFEGSGAGLAITKKIIQRHLGSIWVESKTNEGTKVFFTLPISVDV